MKFTKTTTLCASKAKINVFDFFFKFLLLQDLFQFGTRGPKDLTIEILKIFGICSVQDVGRYKVTKLVLKKQRTNDDCT